jgi:hypothetical protein
MHGRAADPDPRQSERRRTKKRHGHGAVGVGEEFRPSEAQQQATAPPAIGGAVTIAADGSSSRAIWEGLG